MTQLFTLFSSSAGNCTAISSGRTTLLVDAGGSCRRITAALQDHGIDPRSIAGIVLTHEHSDHISALRVLLRRLDIPVFGTFATINYLADNDLVPPGAQLCPVAGGGMIGDIAFDLFPTQHDAGDTCGYTFFTPDGKKIGFATDLGKFTDVVASNLCGSDAVVLESNYDPHMLEVSGYPYGLIRRIKGEYGHLSNEDCAAGCAHLLRSGVRHFLLAHTSKQNNLEELAYQTTLCALESSGGTPEVQLEVAPKFSSSPVLMI
ncbi:MAG: MBL fold metallo-hydrolase [Provencibacterium sp.]|jgi:phosphoribosyl 1,2-cyclic phosphodiesterase|nr:MBL fold metallo-hydrolase [Provencibacterium sp.]